MLCDDAAPKGFGTGFDHRDGGLRVFILTVFRESIPYGEANDACTDDDDGLGGHGFGSSCGASTATFKGCGRRCRGQVSLGKNLSVMVEVCGREV